MGFYSTLREARGDDEALQTCIESVVDQLESAIDPARPGLLLGRIQSGKTRAFLGVVARSFDRGFDIALVMTKGTRTLASQTVKRIGRDFRTFIDNDEMMVFDIMETPDMLTRSELRRKLVIVAKKEHNNLDRVTTLLFETYPELGSRRIILIDDEADLASVRFTKKKGNDEVEQGTIASRIDDLRRLAGDRISFLQVTATPYALYLQPQDYEESAIASEVFYPKRPAFTVLLPMHDAYVGGDDYFGGHGPDNLRYYLYVEVLDKEHDALRSNDGRTIRDDRLWISENILVLRRALLTFLASVSIRRRQQSELEQPRAKFAMIIHNDTGKAAHTWQWDTVGRLARAFEAAATQDDPRLRAGIDAAYDDLARSVTANGGHLPTKHDIYQDVKSLILDGELNVQRVNSDVQLGPLQGR